MFRSLLLVLLLSRLSLAQQTGLVDKSGRVVAVVPDSVRVSLDSATYGRLRAVKNLPPADYSRSKRLGEDDKPTDRMRLAGLPDTLTVDKQQVALKFSVEGGKQVNDPDSLFGTWRIEPSDSLATLHKIYDRGKTRGNAYSPTQKPVALMEYLIKTYTNEGETVLDFTMGSGTTGVACINAERRFIGIELDQGYYDIAASRIAATRSTMQIKFEE